MSSRHFISATALSFPVVSNDSTDASVGVWTEREYFITLSALASTLTISACGELVLHLAWMKQSHCRSGKFPPYIYIELLHNTYIY